MNACRFLLQLPTFSLIISMPFRCMGTKGAVWGQHYITMSWRTNSVCQACSPSVDSTGTPLSPELSDLHELPASYLSRQLLAGLPLELIFLKVPVILAVGFNHILFYAVRVPLFVQSGFCKAVCIRETVTPMFWFWSYSSGAFSKAKTPSSMPESSQHFVKWLHRKRLRGSLH